MHDDALYVGGLAETEFAVTFRKPGYRTEQVQVGTRVAGSGVAGFAGNLIVGGIVGMGVDAATGSTLEHYPNPVFVTMRRGGDGNATRTRRAKKIKDAPQS